MSNLARQLFEGLGRFFREAWEEACHKFDLGRSELAAALFKGSDPFVMYGPNQRSPSVEQEHNVSWQSIMQQERYSPEQTQGREQEIQSRDHEMERER